LVRCSSNMHLYVPFFLVSLIEHLLDVVCTWKEFHRPIVLSQSWANCDWDLTKFQNGNGFKLSPITLLTFSSNMSLLFNIRIIVVFSKYFMLHISSNKSRASTNRFCLWSSNNTVSYLLIKIKNVARLMGTELIWAYADIAATKMTQVTSSKKWIHFFLSFRWPPTSNIWKIFPLISNIFCTTPIVLARVLNICSTVGTYP